MSSKRLKRRLKELEAEVDTLRARIVALEGVNAPKGGSANWTSSSPLNNEAVMQMATGALADMLKSPWFAKK
ncbi:hypothetical protein SEA_WILLIAMBOONE_142 [Gordonia phage WilliamBoone]|nr:hypothetical protein SEA_WILLIAMBOONE_142 [Gordonia phage WilliamBoone]